MPLAETNELPVAEVLSEPAGNRTPEHDSIARLAYDYWLSRGCSEGAADQDWLRAEHDLMTLHRALGELRD